jgi:hypothetical protein
VTNNLQRIRELAVQSANATNSDSDRAALDQEVQQRLAEVNRIATQTSFNGRKVLDGSFGNATFQVGANVGETISVGLATSVKTRTSAITHGDGTVGSDHGDRGRPPHRRAGCGAWTLGSRYRGPRLRAHNAASRGRRRAVSLTTDYSRRRAPGSLADIDRQWIADVNGLAARGKSRSRGHGRRGGDCGCDGRNRCVAHATTGGKRLPPSPASLTTGRDGPFTLQLGLARRSTWRHLHGAGPLRSTARSGACLDR